MHDNTTLKYLPNLNPIRFFAATVVLFYHVDNFLVSNGYKSDFLYFFPFQHGDLAVVAFFALSGFLITHLLIIEKQSENSINIKTFYIKRALRIWPLYFLILLLAIFFLNQSPFFFIDGKSNVVDLQKHPALLAIFLALIAPNIVLVWTTSLGYANPTWSIGVEEQFYLIWPWIVRGKNYLRTVLLIIIIMTLLNHGLIERINNVVLRHSNLKNAALFHAMDGINKFFSGPFSFRIDAMAIGSLGAFIISSKSKVIPAIYSRAFQLSSYGILVILLVFHHMVDYQYYAFLFTVIYINLATNPNSILTIKSKALDYLGRISFGIYMLHLITIIPAIKIVQSFASSSINVKTEIYICLTSLSISILIAALSFETYEKVFRQIRLKLLNGQ